MKHTDRERHELLFDWPTVPFEIILVEPVIPPNTGNIARLCAATGTPLRLIEPLGFDLSEKQVRRAGLDYWEAVNLILHPTFDHYLDATPQAPRHLFTTSAKQDHAHIAYQPGAHLIFGSETHGLSNAILNRFPQQGCNIPIQLGAVRSLNLANAVSIALYTALRNRA
jgi:tRNA (cytidine/uridine-2'-O-)-methyltransferase